MHRTLKLARSLALGASFALAMATQATALEQPETITVFVAKKIVTMNPGQPTATAVAIRGREILSVGSLEDLHP